MKMIIAVVVVLVAVIGGAVGGHFLKPVPTAEEAAEAKSAAKAKEEAEQGEGERAFVKIGKQTILPVLENGETVALMLFEFAVDTKAVQADEVHAVEPRLRDAFLSELYLMSRSGAFLNDFTEKRIIDELRHNLTEAAREELRVKDAEVLILDVMRQKI